MRIIIIIIRYIRCIAQNNIPILFGNYKDLSKIEIQCVRLLKYFDSKWRTIITILLLLSFPSLYAQEGVSIDAMDPRANGETTKKGYTDDEIKWRVGYGVKEGGVKSPAIELNLTGKNALCEGDINIPQGWHVEVIENIGGVQDKTGNVDNALEGLEGEEGNIYENSNCVEGQYIKIVSDTWVSDFPGAGMTLERPNFTSFDIGNSGGDGYVPIVHGSNGSIYLIYHHKFGNAVVQCINVKEGKPCNHYPKTLSSGTRNSGVGNGTNYTNAVSTPLFSGGDHSVFIGDRLFYTTVRYKKDAFQHRFPYWKWDYKQFGISCFDVNTNNPRRAGACDGNYGRALFGDNGYVKFGNTGKSKSDSPIVGPFSINGKLYVYSMINNKLHCYDPDSGDSCGGVYPKSFNATNFKAHARDISGYRRVPSWDEPARGLENNGKIYIALASKLSNRAKNSQLTAYVRCWDVITVDFCWGSTVGTIPAAQNGHEDHYSISLVKRYGSDGEMDGLCSVYTRAGQLDHANEINSGCIYSSDGAQFSKGSESQGHRYGVPLELLDALKSNSKHGNFHGYTLTASKQYRLDDELHGRSYFAGGITNPGGVICWDWTADELCYHYDLQTNQEVTFGGDGHVLYPGPVGSTKPPRTYDYGVTYDSTHGCFWVLGDRNILWSFDARGGFPCSPAAFESSRIIDPAALFCASGAPAGWKWNSIELYDMEKNHWVDIDLQLVDLVTDEVLAEYNLETDSHLFVQETNRIKVNLLNDPSVQLKLAGQERLKLVFNGLSYDAEVIQNNRKPTIIATIDTKKPIEFCVNAKTGVGAAGCGAAYLEASLSASMQSDNKKTGIHIVQYSPDPESHTQPSMYVKQNNDGGFGLIVRPYIFPVLRDSSGKEINGISTMQAMFVNTYMDDEGFKNLTIYEDSNADSSLDADDESIVYVPNDKNGMGVKNHMDDTEIQHFNTVKPLWDAHMVLNEMEDENALNQRSYNTVDSTRYIFTWLDDKLNDINNSLSNNKKVDSGEVVDFLPNIVTDGTRGLFKDRSGGRPGLSKAKIASIIRYVRGDMRIDSTEEVIPAGVLEKEPELTIVGYRDRRIQPPERTNSENFRLSGLRHSKALVVGAPEHSKLSTRYNVDNDYVIDWSYAHNYSSYHAFKEKYKHRRTMVYVGGNDGMIHAFNSGFIDFENELVALQPLDGTSATQWVLGSEVWAYVPRAVFPFLVDLTSPEYKHRYFVDGNPLAYDVKMFTSDTTHPGGWGTILVVPMRMGGGVAKVKLSDGSFNKIRPAYIVLDITDPEQPPKLIAEITHPKLGYTVSEPTIAYEKTTTGIKPLLAFGSGPTNAAFAVSSRPGKVFMYNLRTKTLQQRIANIEIQDSEGNNIPNFVGNMKAVNLQHAFTGSSIQGSMDIKSLATDVFYFGISSGTHVREIGGRLMRLNLDHSVNKLNKLELLMELKVGTDDTTHPGGRPIVYAPEVSISLEGKRDALWIYAVTGRLLVDADESNTEQQFALGIIEEIEFDESITVAYPQKVGPSRVMFNRLVDVTKINIGENGSIFEDQNIPLLQQGITNERQLAQRIVNDGDGDNVDGWLRRFTIEENGSGDGDDELTIQAGRATGRPTIINNILVISEFVPPTEEAILQCAPAGTQSFLKFNKDTGTSRASLLTEYKVFDASLNDPDYILWDGELAVGAGSSTRLEPGKFFELSNAKGRIRWRELDEIKVINYGN